MKNKFLNKVFMIIGALAVIASSSLSFCGMYQPKIPNNFFK